MVLKPDAPDAPARVPLGVASLRCRELLLPVLVAFAALLIAVALLEGPALEQFLYAVF